MNADRQIYQLSEKDIIALNRDLADSVEDEIREMVRVREDVARLEGYLTGRLHGDPNHPDLACDKA